MALVELQNVAKTFPVRGGQTVHAVNGVSLSIEPSETVALIGESGSGKSTVGRLVLGLHRPTSGHITFDGRDISTMPAPELRMLRSEMTVVFQEPDESLNPRMAIGSIVEEPLIIHEPTLSPGERKARVVDALEHVTLSEDLYYRYPHQLSGGQQQRVGIARAIVTRPKFIVLDEPTSSLDLSVRSAILKLLGRLQSELQLAYLFISHDIHTVVYVSDRIAVMYLGQIMEMGPTTEVFANPRHPYTMALLSATLWPDPDMKPAQIRLSGEIPRPTALPRGCLFYSRCPYGDDPRCENERPELREVAPDHWVRTFYDRAEPELGSQDLLTP